MVLVPVTWVCKWGIYALLPQAREDTPLAFARTHTTPGLKNASRFLEELDFPPRIQHDLGEC